MEFDNSFTVNAPLQRVWDFLLNVEEVAPCMPGATLTEVVSDTEYKGTVKVKLGAVQMSYKGTATIRDVDEAAHTMVLVASGRETRGTGNASSTTTSHLVEEGPNRTVVNLHSQVDVSGRVAQFGRSIMQDVASRLIGEFARNLEAKMMEGEQSTSPAAVSSSPGDVPAAPQVAAEPGASAATQSDAPRTAAPMSTRSPSYVAPEPQPIRVLPIMVDVARSQAARGLRKIASIVEPKRRS
jgi:carbon monoxide dehydrogenase subunit G